MREPVVSVIVPTYNSASYLEACLKSVREQTYKAIELIVVDNNSTDNTVHIAKRYADLVLNQGPERSAQRNFGFKHAKGNYVIIPDSDMVFTPEVVMQCVQVMNANTDLKAVVIPEESFGQGFWAQCKKLERSFYEGVDWMEAARFFDRHTFEQMRGYDEKNTGTEDYDLPQRIELEYGATAIGRITAHFLHNEQRINLWKTIKKKFYYAGKMNRYRSVPANQSKFKKQSSMLQRYLLFLRDPVRLLKNPGVGVGMLFMKTAEFAAAGFGFVTAKLRT